MLLFQHILPDQHYHHIVGRSDRSRFAYIYWSIDPFFRQYWVPIPNTKLVVRHIQRLETPCLAFRKEGKTLFHHVFCLEDTVSRLALLLVSEIHGDQIKIPPAPHRRCWIHSIPVHGKRLSKDDLRVIYQLTRHIFARLSNNARAGIELLKSWEEEEE